MPTDLSTQHFPDPWAKKPTPRMTIRGLNVDYGETRAVIDVDLDVHDGEILTLVGPSGCGKSTILNCLNRMHETKDSPPQVKGEILLDGENIHDPLVDIISLRKKIGMVFQQANPFPKTIYNNVAFGPLLTSRLESKFERFNVLAEWWTGKPPISRSDIDDIVEHNLKRVGLWNDVKDILHSSGSGLSGGQKQRLCIARTLANDPSVLLLDEPTSALDWKSALQVEETLIQLKEEVPIVLVTHGMPQAKRIGDESVFMYEGQCLYKGTTDNFFRDPPAIAEPFVRGLNP